MTLKCGYKKKAYGYEGFVKCVINGKEIWRVWSGVQSLNVPDALALAHKLEDEWHLQNKD